MDLSDSTSSADYPTPPPSQTKNGARRGRPRLTEDAELAKMVTIFVWKWLIVAETTGAIKKCATRIEGAQKSTFGRIANSCCPTRTGEFYSEKYGGSRSNT